MIETKDEMKAAAYSWADDSLTRFTPERWGMWRQMAWRMFRPALRHFVAAGYVGGYNAAQNDAEGSPP